jgi:hypothetical protein
MLASAAKAPDENASSHLMKWLRRQLSIGGH